MAAQGQPHGGVTEGLFAGRTDVITRVSFAGTGSGAAACFIPALAEARFSAARLIPDYEQPNRIDPAVPADRARVPVYVGAVIHEAGHAGHTKVVHELPCSAAAQRWKSHKGALRCSKRRLSDIVYRHLVHDAAASWRRTWADNRGRLSNPARPADTPTPDTSDQSLPCSRRRPKGTRRGPASQRPRAEEGL